MLREVMINFGHADTSDPRDKIYTFLGIAKDGHEFLPDYGASVEEVYTGVVMAYIKNKGNLEIICSHHRGYSTISSPSWVPDWSICRSREQNWTVSSFGPSFYGAGYSRLVPYLGVDGKFPSVGGISIQGLHTLKAAGISVGSIEKVAETIEAEPFPTDDWIRAIRSWITEDLECGEYINGNVISAHSAELWR